MKTQRVAFTNHSGERLSGALDMPEGEPRAFALFAHCFTCGKSLTPVRRIAEQLTNEGIALFRFDFTGLGESDGEFADTTFYSNLKDLQSAAAFLQQEHQSPAILIGHSLGGAAALAIAGSLPDLTCIVTIGAPADPTHVKHLMHGAEFDNNGRAEISIGGRPFTIGREFVDDLERHDVERAAQSLGLPLLIFHSPIDRIVGIENAERIFRAAKHPRSFVSLGQADHLMSDARDAALVGHVLSAWASRYIDSE